MPFDVRDIAGGVGLVLIAVGLWWVCPPASLVVTGGLLLGGAVMAARARS